MPVRLLIFATRFFFVLVLVLPCRASADPDSSKVRWARDVAEKRDKSAIPKLIEQLKDSDADARLAAVVSLMELGAKSAIRALLVQAQVDPDERVRRAAAQAVLVMNPKSFASKLGSAEPPPRAQLPEPPLRPRARYAALLSAGGAINALRADESFTGNAAFGLRFGDIEAQLQLGFPAMSLSTRLRWLMVRYPMFTPYLVFGAAASFNNGDELLRTSLAVLGGGGLRYYYIPQVYLQVEAHAAYVFHQPLKTPPKGVVLSRRRVAVPVMLELGVELWPQ
jgi:hypothetical protein